MAKTRGSLAAAERRFRKSKDEIHHFEGLEGVRHRPTMYIGSCGPDGLHHCVLEIIHNSVDEFLAGHCRKIDVTLHKDGSVSVRDDGQGIPVKKHSKAGVSQLELALTRLHAGSKFFQHGDKFSSGLNGVGASCVNALCEWFNADVFRGGGHYRQKYVKGVAQSLVRRVGASEAHGTLIHFKPDAEIFETVEFDLDVLVEMLDDMAFLNPGLKIKFEVEESDDYERAYTTYRHKDGLVDYLAWITEQRVRLFRDPVLVDLDGIFEDRHKKKFRYKMHTAFAYVENDESEIRTFANNVRTTDGGTHEEGLLAGLGRAVTLYAKTHKMVRGIKQLRSVDVTSGGFVCILSFYMHEPRFASQTKKKLTNQEARGAVERGIVDAVKVFLEENPTAAKRIVSRSIDNAKRRERIEDIRTVKKTDSSTLTGKLADCISDDPYECELWLVEGDSAGGSAKTGRDNVTQAVLPLKGKILNVEKASVSKLVQHDEIQQIIAAIGTGVCMEDATGNFNVANRNYDKVIIATDADADGGHITVLLLTFFFRFMRPLIDAGCIYNSCPPLYGVFRGNKALRYFQTEKELDKWTKKREERGKSDKGLSLTRYKGLGEMNPAQLWDTTMNPETRTLRRITIGDVERASKLISVLMGEDVEARRLFIEKHGAKAVIDV